LIPVKQFPNLNGLRFFAALIVLLIHIEALKKTEGYSSLSSLRFFSNSSQIAVTFFFVLSGFLITYFLMNDYDNTKKREKITRFYINRILRIWPLYYVLILIGFFILPNISFFQLPTSELYDKNFNKRFIYYLFFLPNIGAFLAGKQLFIGNVWSLAVEEFFYLFFPLFFYFTSFKRLERSLWIVFVVFVVLCFLLHSSLFVPHNKIGLYLKGWADTYRLYAFAVGSLAAYYFICTPEQVKSIRLDWFWRFSTGLLLMLVILVVFGATFGFFTQQIYSVLFGCFLFCLIYSTKKYRMLNLSLINYLGKISFGIYMLHPLAIIIAIKSFGLQINNGFMSLFLLYVTVILLTIAMSSLSYYFLEKPFLKLRKT